MIDANVLIRVKRGQKIVVGKLACKLPSTPRVGDHVCLSQHDEGMKVSGVYMLVGESSITCVVDNDQNDIYPDSEIMFLKSLGVDFS